MGKVIRFLVILLAVAIGLVIVLAVALPFIIDPNDYKDQIAGVVEKETGRKLNIKGDIDLSVFPWLGLDIGPTTLSNAPGFGDQPFAEMQGVEIRVKLLPLLKKQLEMDTVTLTGLDLRLVKNERGHTNWEDLAGGEKPAEETQPEGESTGEPMIAALAIGGVRVTDASLLWEDRQAHTRYQIEDLNFETGALQPGKPFDLDLGFQVAGGEPDATDKLEGKVELECKVWMSPSFRQFRVEDARLATEVRGNEIPGGGMTANLATSAELDLEKQTLELPELVLETLGLVLHADVNGKAVSGENPQFAGTVAVKEFVPRDVIKALGAEVPKTSDPSVLGKADARAVWTATTRQASVKSLQVRLDDTVLDGQAGVTNFADPAITFQVHADAIDLDRYLPPPEEGEAPAAATPSTAAAGGAAALPVDTLRALNLSGKMKIDKLKAFQLRTADIEVQIKAKDGVVRVNPASARMYQGGYQGDVTLDVSGSPTRLAMNERVSGVQAGPLLKDLTGKEQLTGTGNVHVKLNGRGDTPEQLRKTLNGDTSFSFTDGAVKGVNIAAMLRKAIAAVKGRTLPPDNEPNQTDFAELSGTATVTNGLIRNNDLALKSPLLRITGEGTADLVSEKIDYRLTTKIVGTLKGQGGKELEEVKGVAIPVKIAGTFSEPTYTPDVRDAIAEIAKGKVEERVQKEQEKVEQKLQEKAAEKLKGLFR
jgi:AsmA protein